MRTALTIAFDDRGKPKVVSGPDVPIDQQRKTFQENKKRPLPKGISRVEFWTSDQGRTKTIRPVPVAAEEADDKPAGE